MVTKINKEYPITCENNCLGCIFHYERFVGYDVGGYQGKCFLREEKGLPCPLAEENKVKSER